MKTMKKAKRVTKAKRAKSARKVTPLPSREWGRGP
jgi:hypothetical protein